MEGTTVKTKIDLDKFVLSLVKRYYEKIHIDPTTTKCWLDSVLEDQGFEYKDGEIVKILEESEDKQKFCEGDWIISKYMHLVMQVLDNDNGFYKTLETDGTERNDSYDFIERNFKLWTIADAKPGDVLLSKHNQPFIYNGIFDEDSVGAYCGIDMLGDEFLKGIFSGDWSYKEGVKPATKEQRDLLFSKMKEAGYEWDADKKKLSKHVIDEGKDEIDYCFTKMMNGEKVNSTCSEDDEKIIRRIDSLLYAIHENEFEDIHAWLKSLKNRVQPQSQWKPSKEQIIALRWVLNNIPYNKNKEEISGLLDQIKDL